MATTTPNYASDATLAQTVWASVASFGNSILDVLVSMGKYSSIAKQVDALNAFSDAELEARGTSRHAEIQRIFNGHLYR